MWFSDKVLLNISIASSLFSAKVHDTSNYFIISTKFDILWLLSSTTSTFTVMWGANEFLDLES